jgi:hypothetical protein
LAKQCRNSSQKIHKICCGAKTEKDSLALFHQNDVQGNEKKMLDNKQMQERREKIVERKENKKKKFPFSQRKLNFTMFFPRFSKLLALIS